jgi:hypothetical protein
MDPLFQQQLTATKLSESSSLFIDAGRKESDPCSNSQEAKSGIMALWDVSTSDTNIGVDTIKACQFIRRHFSGIYALLLLVAACRTRQVRSKKEH